MRFVPLSQRTALLFAIQPPQLAAWGPAVCGRDRVVSALYSLFAAFAAEEQQRQQAGPLQGTTPRRGLVNPSELRQALSALPGPKQYRVGECGMNGWAGWLKPAACSMGGLLKGVWNLRLLSLPPSVYIPAPKPHATHSSMLPLRNTPRRDERRRGGAADHLRAGDGRVTRGRAAEHHLRPAAVGARAVPLVRADHAAEQLHAVLPLHTGVGQGCICGPFAIHDCTSKALPLLLDSLLVIVLLRLSVPVAERAPCLLVWLLPRPCSVQAAALSSRHSFSPDLSMGNLLKLIDQQTMKMCDKVGQLEVRSQLSWARAGILDILGMFGCCFTLCSHLQALFWPIAWVCCSFLICVRFCHCPPRMRRRSGGAA